jgi:hypothetical protein
MITTIKGAGLVNSNMNGWEDIKKSSISEEEKKRREEAVRGAVGSVALEGFEPSPEFVALMNRYINGDIELPEMIALKQKEHFVK